MLFLHLLLLIPLRLLIITNFHRIARPIFLEMIRLKLSQLIHEPRIGQNLSSLLSDQIQTIIQTQIIKLDQIGKYNTGAPAHSCKTMYKTASDFPSFFQKCKTLLKIFAQILGLYILGQHLLMELDILGTVLQPCSVCDG